MGRDSLIPYDELFGDRFVSSNFDKNCDNIMTGATHTHHCKECGKSISRNCYLNGHAAFCAVFVKNKEGEWVRHGQRFMIKSGGCGVHSKLNGFNLAFVKAFKTGVPADISEFEEYDQKYVTEGKPVEDEQAAELNVEAMAEQDIELAIERGEYRPDMSLRHFHDTKNSRAGSTSTRQQQRNAKGLHGSTSRQSAKATSMKSYKNALLPRKGKAGTRGGLEGVREE